MSPCLVFLSKQESYLSRKDRDRVLVLLGHAILRRRKNSWSLVYFCYTGVGSMAEYPHEGDRKRGTKIYPDICQYFSKDIGFTVIEMLSSFLLPLLSISKDSSNHQLCINSFP